MEFTGVLTLILEPITGESSNGQWKKQGFVFKTTGEYPKNVAVTVWGDKGLPQEGMNIGGTYKVAVELESREYNGKWYSDIKAWKIVLEGAAPTIQQNIAEAKPVIPETGVVQASLPVEEETYLPF